METRRTIIFSGIASFRKTIWMLIALSMAVTTWAQEPKWVGNTPQELNNTYKFVEIVSTGNTLEAARQDAKSRLAEDTQLQEGVRVYRRTNQQTVVDSERSSDGQLNETIRDRIHIDLTVDGEQYALQAVRVDEYAERRSGLYTLHTLYMVAVCKHPLFDRTYLTTSYGFAPVAMSVIPGLGQWYKGSRVKGASMFLASAAAVAGIIVCDNQKASYVKLGLENKNLMKEYNLKADRWETGRNICIGVAAGLWLYNIIDAAVAKGARRVVVQHPDGRGLTVMPYAGEKTVGLLLSYKF